MKKTNLLLPVVLVLLSMTTKAQSVRRAVDQGCDTTFLTAPELAGRVEIYHPIIQNKLVQVVLMRRGDYVVINFWQRNPIFFATRRHLEGERHPDPLLTKRIISLIARRLGH